MRIKFRKMKEGKLMEGFEFLVEVFKYQLLNVIGFESDESYDVVFWEELIMICGVDG